MTRVGVSSGRFAPPSVFGIACLVAAMSIVGCSNSRDAIEWPAYGRDDGGTRFLPADRINRDNVHTLVPAWTYDTGDAGPMFTPVGTTRFQVTPVLSTGTLYFPTSSGRVIALDPATGLERWVFDRTPNRETRPSGRVRGVAVWLDPATPDGADCRRRLFVVLNDVRLRAIDADTGQPCVGFGRRGAVDLRQGLRIPPNPPMAFTVHSPPLAANGLVVVGSTIQDNLRPEASGEVRAFDARTGALRWRWDPVPQDPADPARDEWHGSPAAVHGAANAWTVFAADLARDLLFVPTSSPAPDHYGALRLGDNRYANSIVALRLSTGERVWSFQTVHHDLWDYDNPAPPALVSITRDGVEIPVVLVATKTGMLFVLHRDTGVPVFPVEERAVPPSDVPGEVAAATQPFAASIAPLSPHHLRADEAWGPTSADRTVCRDTIAGLRNQGIFTPPSERGTLLMPSVMGGAHWGGVAVDPRRQVTVVPVNRIASVAQLIPRAAFDRDQIRADDARQGAIVEYADMPDTPYVLRHGLLMGPSGLPCSPPPWGTLVAVDLKTGARLWETPLGAFTRPFSADVARGMDPAWGSPNLGGPIVTAGGVVFIGAAFDRTLHAYDIDTGRELWRGALAESARATPMSYQLSSGEQFVVVAVSGHAGAGTTDHLAAFRLPGGRNELAQAVTLAITARSFGLLPLGLIVFAVWSVPMVVAAGLAARARSPRA